MIAVKPIATKTMQRAKADSKYMMDFLVTARETSAATLVGVKQTDQQGQALQAPEDCL
jgi:hypothetical protein